MESLGGPPTHGIGFALGLDRILLACDDEKVFTATATPVDVFVVDTTGGREALRITALLRANDISCDRAFGNRSMKSQMKGADRSGAPVALIIGTNELDENVVIVRPLRGADAQRGVARTDLIPEVRQALEQARQHATEEARA